MSLLVSATPGGSTAGQDDLVERFRAIPPATIGHVVDEGFLDSAIRPVFTPVRLVGRAVTVQMPRGDTAVTRAAIEALRPGSVLVIAQEGDTQVTSWGETTSLAAKMRGAVGVIVDGAVTDSAEIRAQGQPTFARALTARVGRRLSPPGGAVSQPVVCGGVTVHPGDLVVADDNGIVVLAPERAEAVYEAAYAAELRAPWTRRWLEHGGDLGAIAGQDAAAIQALLRARGWLE